jgi:alkaline phosphatase
MSACPTNAKEHGGAGSIAEQMIATAPDVLLGGGQKYFDQNIQSGRYGNLSVLQQAQAGGYQVVTALASARRCPSVDQRSASSPSIRARAISASRV